MPSYYNISDQNAPDIIMVLSIAVGVDVDNRINGEPISQSIRIIIIKTTKTYRIKSVF